MLRPEYQMVGYIGHEHNQTREELLEWLRSLSDRPRGKRIGLRCYVGPGGSGKTRLLLEVGKSLQNEGWITGFLVPGSVTPTNSHLFIDSKGATLLVLDYAGTRFSEINILLDALAGDRYRQHPYALILLDRSEPDWLQSIVQRGSDPNYSGRTELHLIGTIESTARKVPQMRQTDLYELYKNGIKKLANAIEKIPPQHSTLPLNLPSRPLYVLLLSLLTIAGEPLPDDTTDETSILTKIWEWMLSQWQTRLTQDQEMEYGWIEDLILGKKDTSSILEELLIITTLGHVFSTEQELADFLKTHEYLPQDKFGRTPDSLWLAHRITQLLPPYEDQLGIMSTIQPDPLADWVIYRFCIEHDSILDWLNNIFSSEKSTLQAAIIFHRLLARYSNLYIEEKLILKELCKWADRRLKPNEVPVMRNTLKTLFEPISEQESAISSITMFENISRDIIFIK